LKALFSYILYNHNMTDHALDEKAQCGMELEAYHESQYPEEKGKPWYIEKSDDEIRAKHCVERK